MLEGIKLKGVYTFTIRNAKTGRIKRIYRYENLITTVGLTMIANNLTATSPTNVMRIKVSALGTGTTPPAAEDTTLETEVFRKLIASEVNDVSTAYYSAFYTASETSGTYREVGIFCDADAAVTDDGILFSHAAINVTKSLLETLTIDYTLTITDNT